MVFVPLTVPLIELLPVFADIPTTLEIFDELFCTTDILHTFDTRDVFIDPAPFPLMVITVF